MFALFVTSKIELSNPPILQFSNLKYFKMPLNLKMRLKIFFEVMHQDKNPIKKALWLLCSTVNSRIDELEDSILDVTNRLVV